MSRVAGVVCCWLVVGAVTGAVVVTGESAYSVTIPGSIETPERTVSVDGSSYTVDSLAKVSQGETLEVQTDGPDGESYRVYVHAVENGTRSVYDSQYVGADSDGTVTFSTGSFDAGSYVVSVYHDGTYYDPHPVVVPAYEVSTSVPGTVSTEDAVELSATITEVIEGKSVDSVEFVIADDEATIRRTATNTGAEYAAEVPADAISAGEYRVYAVVYGTEETPADSNEVIGVSGEETLVVTSKDRTTTTSGAGGGGGGGGSESTTAASTTSAATSTTAGTTATARTTAVGTTAGDTETSSTAEATTSGSTTVASVGEDTTTAPATTTDSVITPATSGRETTPATASNGVVGEAPLALLALLASVGLLVWRRSE